MKGNLVLSAERSVPLGIGRAEDPDNRPGEGAGCLEGKGVAADQERCLFDQGHDFFQGKTEPDRLQQG